MNIDIKNKKEVDIDTILTGDVLSILSISANQVNPKGAKNTMNNTMKPLKAMNFINFESFCFFDLFLMHKESIKMNTQHKLKLNKASNLSGLNTDEFNKSKGTNVSSFREF